MISTVVLLYCYSNSGTKNTSRSLATANATREGNTTIMLVLQWPSGAHRIGFNGACIGAQVNCATCNAEAKEWPDIGCTALCCLCLDFFMVGE